MNVLKNVFKSLLSIVVLLASTQLQANISPLAFKEIFKHFKPGYELYAPNIGCAALKNGTIDAIRFYNVIPGSQDSQGRRLYIQDKALKNDPFVELAILLFPSPAGQLTAMTSHGQNIGAQLTVYDIAAMLNFCARIRAAICTMKANKGLKGNQLGKKIKRAFAHLCEALDIANNRNLRKEIKKHKKLYLYANNTLETYFKWLKIPDRFLNDIPHAQVLLKLLYRCIEIEERDDRRQVFRENPNKHKCFDFYCDNSFYPKYTPEMLLNAFFCLKFGSEEIQTLIQNLDEQLVDHQAMFEYGLIDQGNLEDAAKKSPDQATLDDLWVIQNRDLIDAVIPYARQCVPVNNGLACGYDRVNNQLLENRTYPDCTETTIRHLCNLVLYNKQTKHWDVEHALKKISDVQTYDNLEAFYQIQKPEQANSGEAAVRNAWSKVVNNLDGNIRYNKKFLPPSIKNDNDHDNEISSGLVNIMRLLNIVFELGLESEPVYHNDNQYEQAVTQWATSGLETFFKTLAPEKQNVAIQIYNVATYTAADHRKDCSAIITVQVEQDFKFVMSISSGHAQFDSITTLVQVSQDKIASCAQQHDHRLQYSGEQILLLNAATKDYATTPLHKLFSINVIDSAAIITMLKQLHLMLVSNHITDARAALILQNALQRFLWQDLQMSRNIQTILSDLFSLRNNEIRAVLSKEVKVIGGNKWLNNCFNNNFNNNFSDLLKFFTALESIDLSWSGIKSIQISGTCPNLKKLDLSHTPNIESLTLSGSFNALESIDLSWSGIKALEISGTCSNLKNLNLRSTQNLKSVTLSSSLNALASIYLSYSRIKALEISGTCPNLKQLYLDKTQNLESLTLSGSLNALEKITLWGSEITELILDKNSFPKLKTDDPRIKLIDKKRKRDEKDNFEEEISKENKLVKLADAEQPVGQNNANDEIMDN
ncbi:leucine-rich repeat domain-containing protein [Candidatus Dependentiae bacterium]|nr:leucine-rich repeat domain-containing protein [Candidatus Dependentiae bacterium]